MKYFIIQDGKVIGSSNTREEAVELIQLRLSRETHYLKSNYWIIKGTEDFLRGELI